ncbi:serine/threonine protein kinase [Sulfurifustis variabilis]|uniref:non-specific serine/threonine protein kinase n=1 Tax=Sulfurifustis variabilis TaxID=1675686 RepID=A0A1B4VCR7_9GAMM|nr:serine/threonine-protein kinase [Sulfurifustis variabilis]BAU46727.1 serine/threonine protein kinase [Sulfurifustis variabilis]
MHGAARFYGKDWFAALLLGSALAAAALTDSHALRRLELLVYDAGVRMTSRVPGASEDIVIVAIDDPSIEEIGPWPWPRDVLAEATDRLVRGKAKAVGLLVPLDEPRTDRGLEHFRSLRAYLDANPLPRNLRQRRHISRLLAEAEYRLDTDAQLAKVMSPTGPVFIPMALVPGVPSGDPVPPLPEHVRRHRLTKVSLNEDTGAASSAAARLPLEVFARRARGIGHMPLDGEAGKDARSHRLVLEYAGEHYASLPLLLAARSLYVRPARVEIELGDGVRIAKVEIRTDSEMRMYPGFYPSREGEPAFAGYSFRDVRAGRVPAGAFRNKIVLVGMATTDAGRLYATPLGPMSAPEVAANVVASMLNQDYYERPDWSRWIEAALFGLVFLYLAFVMPRLAGRRATTVSATLLVALLLAGHYLLLSERLWLQTATPALFLVSGHLLLATRRLFGAARVKREADADSAQTNRLLGLAFQGQGQLDMALDKFRKLPADDSVLELFYNLALDFERKRQFSKAAGCYDHILRRAPGFRDAAERKQRAAAAERAVMLGPVAGSGTIVLDAMEKPRLGRYEVEKELGRGAMGTVYLGRDPRIGRVVAIKTIALSQFEEAERPQVRERFFREAEAAGRLNHPNIVTIYDAGEEQDLGFIAMELLEGKDLTHYVQPGKELPLEWVVDVVTQVADALDYAHRCDVVHRDIKPANIMHDDAKQSVKVTDFGIARITDSNNTRTGVIMGSPFYMSPEQLAGKPVDGRSDLFSLGVTLFELLAGVQPFRGDSMAALMYQIANEPHPDILAIRPALPPRLKSFLDKALRKDPSDRFQTGAEFRDALVAGVRVRSVRGRARRTPR